MGAEERTMRAAQEQTRPGWVLFEVLEGDVVVKRLAIPRDPIFVPGDDDDD